MLFTYGEPMGIISRAGDMWDMYYSWGSISSRSVDENTIVAEISGCDVDEFIVERICGWIEKTLTIIGCQNVRVSHERSGEICRITAVWSGIREI